MCGIVGVIDIMSDHPAGMASIVAYVYVVFHSDGAIPVISMAFSHLVTPEQVSGGTSSDLLSTPSLWE